MIIDHWKRVTSMAVSYRKLWKMLIDKDMKKKDLQAATKVSWATITRLSKSEPVSMEVLGRICEVLDCDIGDIVEFVKEEEP
jgi:DNA-binding Xre family transcriptional regulator